jgi:hypothetical protein
MWFGTGLLITRRAAGWWLPILARFMAATGCCASGYAVARVLSRNYPSDPPLRIGGMTVEFERCSRATGTRLRTKNRRPARCVIEERRPPVMVDRRPGDGRRFALHQPSPAAAYHVGMRQTRAKLSLARPRPIRDQRSALIAFITSSMM